MLSNSTENNRLMVACLQPYDEIEATPDHYLDDSLASSSRCLLDLKIKRKELQDIMNYAERHHSSLSKESIIKKAETGLPYSFALNSITNTPIILLKKHRLEELARNIFSVSLAYDIKLQKVMVYKSGPMELFNEMELKINKILYNSIHRDKFVATDVFYNYSAPIKTPNLIGINYPKGTDKIGFFLEYQSNGHLGSFIENTGLSLHKALKIARRVGKCVNILHSEFKIVHNDLKFDNILVSKEGAIRLADFGKSHFEKEALKSMGTARFGPPESKVMYLCSLRDLEGARPLSASKFFELLHFNTFETNAHPSIDVWSFGVILIGLFGNADILQKWFDSVENYDKLFFSFESIKNKLINDLSSSLNLKIDDKRCVEKIIYLISKCLEYNAQNRPTMDEVLELLSEIKIYSSRFNKIYSHKFNSDKTNFPGNIKDRSSAPF